MEEYVLYVAGFGALALLTAWLPMVLQALPLSLPICCVAIGALLSLVPSIAALVPRPERDLPLFQHATEAVVVVSLMGAGLKIDRPIGWRRWSVTWRMLGLAMPLTILALTALAMGLLGLGAASALLLASSLAPTDPVLASDVQVGEPSEEHEDDARFALTSEAGLNDGLAFPSLPWRLRRPPAVASARSRSRTGSRSTCCGRLLRGPRSVRLSAQDLDGSPSTSLTSGRR